ncbi:hypothetical protein GCM10010510_01530 [Streptomyces anandii JCM 4720]|nr:hypothetical protein GCM10010510_01530 [Streptomyces anandii JCM 4720]
MRRRLAIPPTRTGRGPRRAHSARSIHGTRITHGTIKTRPPPGARRARGAGSSRGVRSAFRAGPSAPLRAGLRLRVRTAAEGGLRAPCPGPGLRSAPGRGPGSGPAAGHGSSPRLHPTPVTELSAVGTDLGQGRLHVVGGHAFGRCSAARADEGAVEVAAARVAVVHDAGRVSSARVAFLGAPVKVLWGTERVLESLAETVTCSPH